MLKIKAFAGEHLTYSQDSELNQLSVNERLWIGAAVILVLLVSAHDIVEDWSQGQQFILIAGDIAYMAVMLALLVYLWHHLPRSLQRANMLLTQQVVERHKDARSWQMRAAEIMAGFSRLISTQLEEWGLTDAEKQVALLLLKGLSIKEIAVIRGTTHSTVRQQAVSVYGKAGLRNRSELSAFFLEDILVVETQAG